MLFFELFSLNLSRLFHCSVIKVLCPAVLRDNFYILSQLSAFVNRFFHKKNNFLENRAEKEGVEPSRRLPDLYPKQGHLFGQLEYFSEFTFSNVKIVFFCVSMTHRLLY